METRRPSTQKICPVLKERHMESFLLGTARAVEIFPWLRPLFYLQYESTFRSCRPFHVIHPVLRKTVPCPHPWLSKNLKWNLVQKHGRPDIQDDQTLQIPYLFYLWDPVL